MLKELKNLLYATLITAFFIFVFVQTVEAHDDIHSVTDPHLIEISTELLDKDMAIMVLGGIDYYVQECTPLTSKGVIYRNKIITYHKINKSILPLHPTYIKGALAVSGYDCYQMFDLIQELEEDVVEQPTHPVDKQQSISEID